MKLRRADWPAVIVHLVTEIVEVAKQQGVRGAISVHEVDRGSERHYEIVVRVPARNRRRTRDAAASALTSVRHLGVSKTRVNPSGQNQTVFAWPSPL